MSNIDEIKSRADIVEVIGKVVSLKKAGSNYKGLCPFHTEKTPSFIVSEQKQIFTCFGCGASGDVIEFTQKYYGLDFREAMEQLAEQYGIVLEQSYGNQEKRDRFYEMNREAATYFFKRLRQDRNKALAYAAKRGLSKETLHTFGIGYADESWTGLYDYMKGKGYKDRELLQGGLVSQSGKRIYDKFRDRLIFPIWNTRGRVIGFGGRILGDGEPKYLNSPETPVFQKKSNLYGLYQSRGDISKEDRAIMVEGYMDVVSLYQAGVRNVVASLGTALTENQANLIRRYTKNVVLSYDSDSAGVAAALRGMDVLRQANMHVKVMHVTDGKDPDEFVKTNGPEAFVKLADEALPYGEYKIRHLEQQYDLDDVDEKISFLQAAVAVLRSLSPVEADLYAQQLSGKYNISPAAIQKEMGRQERGAPPERERTRARGEPLTALEKNLLKIILTESSYLERPDLTGDLFTTDTGQAVWQAMRDIYGATGNLSETDLMDALPEEAAEKLREVWDRTILAGDPETLYRECLKKAHLDSLKKQEQRLIQQLALAEEEKNPGEIRRLTQALIEAQKAIRDEGGN